MLKQCIPGFVLAEVRNVDDGQTVCRLDCEKLAGAHCCKAPAGLQNRHRAIQPAKVVYIGHPLQFPKSHQRFFFSGAPTGVGRAAAGFSCGIGAFTSAWLDAS